MREEAQFRMDSSAATVSKVRRRRAPRDAAFGILVGIAAAGILWALIVALLRILGV